MRRWNRRLIAAKLPLNGLAEVLQQMKTISDPPRLRRALTRGLRIEASTIATDRLHVRLILEPPGHGRRRTIRQHVHHLTTLKVNDDRPVVGALPPRPVIDASHMDGGHGGDFGPSPGVLPQVGQDRRVADRHPEPSHQPLRRPSASAMTKQLDDSCQAGGPARERRRKTRHALGEDAPITQLVSTPPAPKAGINNDRRSLSGYIPERSPVSAVARFDCAPHPGQKVGCRLSTVTVQACSRRSTLTTFKPAPGDHAIDVFIAPCCRVPSQGASR